MTVTEMSLKVTKGKKKNIGTKFKFKFSKIFEFLWSFMNVVYTTFWKHIEYRV